MEEGFTQQPLHLGSLNLESLNAAPAYMQSGQKFGAATLAYLGYTLAEDSAADTCARWMVRSATNGS